MSEPHAGAWSPLFLQPWMEVLSFGRGLSESRAAFVLVWDKGASCPMCKQTLDIMGDHAQRMGTSLSATIASAIVDSIAREGHLSPVLEKKFGRFETVRSSPRGCYYSFVV